MTTTTIERIFSTLRTLMEVDFSKVSSRPYKQSTDAFSFDYSPRSDFDSWFIDPPLTVSAGLVSDVEHVQASTTIWLSRDAGEDAGGAAVALAGDLSRLRHQVVGLTFDGPADVNIHESIRAVVQPRREGEVTVVGQLQIGFDYEATAEHP